MRASRAVLLFFTVAAAEKTLDASCAPPIHPPPLLNSVHAFNACSPSTHASPQHHRSAR